MPPNVQMSTFAVPRGLPERRFDLKCLLSARQQAFLEQVRTGRRSVPLPSLWYPPPEWIEVKVRGRAAQCARPASARSPRPLPPPRTSSLAATRPEITAPRQSPLLDPADRAACLQFKPKTCRAPEPPRDVPPWTERGLPPNPTPGLPPKPSLAQNLKRRCAKLMSGPLGDACRAARDCSHRLTSWLGRLLRRSQA